MLDLGSTRRPIVIWAVLVAATVTSFELVGGHLSVTPQLAASFVISIAFVKVRFVGLEFMELRDAPIFLRTLFEAWVVLAAVALVALYRFGPDLF